MRRRNFITVLGAAAAWPIVAHAQQAERVRRVGVLSFAAESDPNSQLLRKMGEELGKLGWVEGRNLRLDYRFAAGDLNRTRVFAADLVRLAPDVIVARFGVAASALQTETRIIPIVLFGAGDPIQGGVVKSATHPEGNITGFGSTFASLGSKWLELLKETAPSVTRVGFLPINPNTSYRAVIEAVAPSLGMQVVTIPICGVAELPAAIRGFAAEPNGGLIVAPGLGPAATVEIIQLAAQFRLPAIYSGDSYLREGALVTYASDPVELYRGAANYVDRLLRGVKISDLPVQYPTKFHLGINLKTAKALGLEVSASMQQVADEVIE
jgi:putative tryptophan/tyrosine transport system substrate-binding protein